jgi:hypothetical protein
VIDREGMIDNCSAVAAGRIFWHEIRGLAVSEVAGQRFLAIHVADPDRLLARIGSVRRAVGAGSARTMGSSVDISAGALRVDFDQLVRTVADVLARHRRAGEAAAR